MSAAATRRLNDGVNPADVTWKKRGIKTPRLLFSQRVDSRFHTMAQSSTMYSVGRRPFSWIHEPIKGYSIERGRKRDSRVKLEQVSRNQTAFSTASFHPLMARLFEQRRQQTSRTSFNEPIGVRADASCLLSNNVADDTVVLNDNKKNRNHLRVPYLFLVISSKLFSFYEVQLIQRNDTISSSRSQKNK